MIVSLVPWRRQFSGISTQLHGTVHLQPRCSSQMHAESVQQL